MDRLTRKDKQDEQKETLDLLDLLGLTRSVLAFHKDQCLGTISKPSKNIYIEKYLWSQQHLHMRERE